MSWLALAPVVALALVGLEVEPRRALTDEPVRVQLSGLEVGRVVTLRATVTDGAGITWESVASFRADGEGRVDPAEHAPLSGTYRGVDPRGLFWSMRALDVEGAEPRFSTAGLDHSTLTLSAEADGTTLATAELERVYPWAGDALRRETLDDNGLVGTLWTPPGGKPLPAILMLGGSGGSPQTMRAALLAARGYAVLDLQYFGGDPLPGSLVEIPLDYFATAIEWLGRHPAVDPHRLGVFGTSKGAELALLLGTLHPTIQAITAYMPSAVVWQGLSFKIWSPRSSWTRAGEPLPYVRFPLTRRTLWGAVEMLLGRPVAVRGTYELGLLKEAEVVKATIPVERIQGGLLLVSGTDDQVCPCSAMADMIVARLREHGFRYEVQNLVFEGAGHGLGTPYFPRSLSRISSWSGDAGRLLHGGFAQNDERASALGWAATLDLFERYLGRDDVDARPRVPPAAFTSAR